PKHQFQVQIRPNDANGHRLPEVSFEKKAMAGTADRKVQAYNFRVCMTNSPNNRVAFPRPQGYTPKRYELLALMLAEMDKIKQAGPIAPRGDPMYRLKQPWSLEDVMKPDPVPNGKTDTNNNGAFSTDYIGGSYGYPDGDYATRAQIWQAHVDYVQGFL